MKTAIFILITLAAAFLQAGCGSPGSEGNTKPPETDGGFLVAAAEPGENTAFNGPMVTDLAYLPDGKSLLAVYQEIGIVLWDLETGKPVRVMDDSHQCMTFATTSDGKWVLGGRISLWEVATGKKAITMETKVDPILWTTNEA